MPHSRTPTRWGDRERRRSDILTAARELVEREGYAGLNVREVARNAGVALGTIYTYFASKEELYALLYAERLGQFHAQIAPVCATAGSLEEVFVGIAQAYLDLHRDFGGELNLWTALTRQADTPLEVAPPLVDAAGRVMSTLSVAWERLGPLTTSRAVDRSLAFPFLWATLTGLADHFVGARHELHPYTWDQLASFAARTLVAGMTVETRSR